MFPRDRENPEKGVSNLRETRIRNPALAVLEKDRESFNAHSGAQKLGKRFGKVNISFMLLRLLQHHFDGARSVEPEAVRIIMNSEIDECTGERIREE